ncbi:hypothetical protein [Thiohalophilus sp.]|uniref:hypothetical protein n=1 Tax=Thiohalophilus sp. TaxID=3028392 RepID=UPI002ACD5BEE|nr:hypothetical protein [Thiohalophilus sp.]MDZ7661522.1 hypothetical protein [Thiohalophilus sp.]
MSQIPVFAGATIRTLETALEERYHPPLELHRADIRSRRYPTDREPAVYRGKGGCLFVQAGHELRSNTITELSQ